MFRTPLLIATLIGLSLADDSSLNDALLNKSFENAHDKKDLMTVEHGGLFKRAPMEFQSMRGKKDSIDIEDNLLQEDFDKRARMGFQGMRGKKDYFAPDFEDAYFKEDYEKRAPLGFQSMRGKKTMSEEDYYKRAPMGFQGMRGKKSLEEVLDEIDKRTMGFQGTTRGKQIYLLEYPEEYEKRALAMGFQGMRGKKEAYPMEWEKRAPMGFQGMRGKKALYDELITELDKRPTMDFEGLQGREYINDNYLDYFTDPNDFDKRAPMGFQGMRGKKDGDKRAPMGFQGMRGKRNTVQVYGIYGKETPTEYQDIQ